MKNVPFTKAISTSIYASLCCFWVRLVFPNCRTRARRWTNERCATVALPTVGEERLADERASSANRSCSCFACALAERFQYRRVRCTPLAQRSLGHPVQFCSVCWCVSHSAWERAAFIRGRNYSLRPESERNGFSVTFIDGEWCQTWWWMNGNYRRQSSIIDLNRPERGPPEFVMLLRSRKVAFDPPEECSRLGSAGLRFPHRFLFFFKSMFYMYRLMILFTCIALSICDIYLHILTINVIVLFLLQSCCYNHFNNVYFT